MTKTCSFVLLFALCAASAQAEVYRWVDKDGKVQYSDTPPLNAKAEQRKLTDSKIDASKIGYETQRAMQVAPVTLYVADDCKTACEQARKLLSTRKVPFAESSVKTKEDVDALGALTGNKAPRVPTLAVGKKALEGFEAGAWDSALDAVGYPKAL